jgi:hypothetical protein
MLYLYRLLVAFSQILDYVENAYEKHYLFSVKKNIFMCVGYKNVTDEGLNKLDHLSPASLSFQQSIF